MTGGGLLFCVIVGLSAYVAVGVLWLSAVAAKDALRERLRRWLGVK